MRRYGFVVLLVSVFLLATLTACDALKVLPAAATPSPTALETAPPTPSPTPEPTPSPTQEPTPTPTPEPTPTPVPTPASVDLLFAGDIMYHGPTVEQQWDEAQGKYDFTSYFEKITPVIQQADFAIGNLESPVWDPKDSVLGDLRFAAPPEAIEALKAAGFDVLATANNHAMDQGLDALANTVEVLGANGILTTGTYRNEEEKNRICMLEHDGVKVALLAYTRFVNRSWRNKEGMGVNCIDVDEMIDAMGRARAAGADAVVFYLHCGTEYTHEADSYQKSVFNKLQAAGADMVIGHHPHVLQPFMGEPGEDFFAVYSLGNVVTYRASWDRQFAALLKITVTKDPVTGKVTLGRPSYVPTWARLLKPEGGKGQRMYVYDIREAIAACEAGTDPLLPKKLGKELNNGLRIITNVLGEDYMDGKAD